MLAVVEVGDPRLIAIGDLTGQGVVALHERACSAQALGDSVKHRAGSAEGNLLGQACDA